MYKLGARSFPPTIIVEGTPVSPSSGQEPQLPYISIDGNDSDFPQNLNAGDNISRCGTSDYISSNGFLSEQPRPHSRAPSRAPSIYSVRNLLTGAEDSAS